MRERVGVRFITFTGGEPLLHPRIAEMARTAARMGMQATMVTNGWLLPGKLDAIVGTGISTVFVSIDSEDAAAHEKNRGLKGVCERIRGANKAMAERGLRRRGRRAGHHPGHNPRASIADMRRRLRGEAERFHCFAGYKYFYLDWNYDLWRCEDWNAPMCPVWGFEPGKTVRDGCQACTTDCYRDASVMLHFAVALGDAFARLSEGRPVAVAAALADRRNAASLGVVVGHGSRLARLAGVG